MAVAFVLSKRMQKSITEPLDAIATVARAVVNGRDYSLRAAKISDDEIGMVVDAFNKMLDEVQVRTLELGEADRRKDEFLATLAHELRNPLAPIRNALHILKLPGVDDAMADQTVAMMERQVQHLVRLVDDLLDMSRVMRGKIELRKEQIELASVVAR